MQFDRGVRRHFFGLSVAIVCGWVSGDVSGTPHAKVVFEGMDIMFHNHTPWDDWLTWSSVMAPYWKQNFTYDYIFPFPKTYGLESWFRGEHTAYNEAFPGYDSSLMISAGTNDSLTSMGYHLARWQNTFAGVPAPADHPIVRVRDLDFYFVEDGRISYNWCMVDLVDILQQGGYRVLPAPPLPDDGLYPPPRANDGLPAPDSKFVRKGDAARAEQCVRQMLQEDLVLGSHEAKWWADDMVWYGPAGIGTARSRAAYVQYFLRPFHEAFNALEAKIDMVVCEGTYCGAHLHLSAKHTGAWLGEEATMRRVSLRFGIHVRIALDPVDDGCGPCGHIAEAWVQLDIPAAFSQMGVDLIGRAQREAASPTLWIERQAASPSPWIHDSDNGHLSMPTQLASRFGGGLGQLQQCIAFCAFVGLVFALVCRRKSCMQKYGQGVDEPFLQA